MTLCDNGGAGTLHTCLAGLATRVSVRSSPAPYGRGVLLRDGAAKLSRPAHLMTDDAPLPPAPQIGPFAGHLQHTNDRLRKSPSPLGELTSGTRDTEPVAPLRRLYPIAVRAQQLQVAGLVLSVVAQGHDVVDLEPRLCGWWKPEPGQMPLCAAYNVIRIDSGTFWR